MDAGCELQPLVGERVLSEEDLDLERFVDAGAGGESGDNPACPTPQGSQVGTSTWSCPCPSPICWGRHDGPIPGVRLPTEFKTDMTVRSPSPPSKWRDAHHASSAWTRKALRPKWTSIRTRLREPTRFDATAAFSAVGTERCRVSRGHWPGHPGRVGPLDSNALRSLFRDESTKPSSTSSSLKLLWREETGIMGPWNLSEPFFIPQVRSRCSMVNTRCGTTRA